MGEEKNEEESGERAMKGKIALVVVGYNRPASMKRILESLKKSHW